MQLYHASHLITAEYFLIHLPSESNVPQILPALCTLWPYLLVLRKHGGMTEWFHSAWTISQSYYRSYLEMWEHVCFLLLNEFRSCGPSGLLGGMIHLLVSIYSLNWHSVQEIQQRFMLNQCKPKNLNSLHK